MPKRHIIWITAFFTVTGILLIIAKPTRQGGALPQESRALVETCEQIQENYYKEIDPDAVQQRALEGIFNSGLLDEYSQYLPPRSEQAVTSRVFGKRCDLGLILDYENFTRSDKIFILGVRYNSPAHKAKLKAGDFISRIQNFRVADLTAQQIRNLLKLSENQQIALVVQRAQQSADANPQADRVELTVKNYPVQTVAGLCRIEGKTVYKMPARFAGKNPNGTAKSAFYMKISEFCPQTPTEIREVLMKCNSAELLVIDLRGNPGGLMESAAESVDLFLAEGAIATKISRDSLKTIRAHSSAMIPKIPIVLLVDSDTASAAELFAGALQYNARAVVAGWRTRGKGCVQQIHKLPGNLGAISLTNAEFMVDPTKAIQKNPGALDWGIDPNFAGQTQTNSTQIESNLNQLRRTANSAGGPAIGKPGAVGVSRLTPADFCQTLKNANDLLIQTLDNSGKLWIIKDQLTELRSQLTQKEPARKSIGKTPNRASRKPKAK